MAAVAQTCPVCARAVEPSPRYPDYVCVPCARTACSADGRPLRFYNESFSGGFVARHADDDSPYDSHHCFVAGMECWADEAHMGGIVLRPRRK